MGSTGAFEGLDGIQSGIASKKIIDALVATRQERVNKLAEKKADLQTRVNVYSKVQGLVTELKGIARTLSLSSSLGNLAAISSSPNKVEGVVTGTAVQGHYKVHVDSVASASRYYSDTLRSETQKGLLGEGELRIAVGDDTPVARTEGEIRTAEGADTAPYGETQNPAQRSSGRFTIDENTTLQSLKDDINAAGLGVNAQITRSDKGYALVVNGMKTGKAHAVTIQELPFGAGGEEATGQLLNLNHQASVAKDTVIRVDGQDTRFSSETEVVQGAIPQVSIKVSRGAETEQDIELRLETNPESVKAQLEQFVEAYNRLMRTLYETGKKAPAAPDPRNPLAAEMQGQDDADDFYVFNADGTQTASDKKIVNPDRYKLSGDKTISRLAEELQNMMISPVSELISGPQAPSHVGVVGARDMSGNLRKDGTIVIDDEKLKRAVLSDYEGVLKVFTADPVRGTSGVFGRITHVLEDYSFNPSTNSGPLDANEATMESEIRRVRGEIESRQESVDSYRRVLSAQFVELEKFMAKHKAQGDFLNAIASAVSKR